MEWYKNAVFYHIYPLGLGGCEHQNLGTESSKFDIITQWTEHAAKMNCTAVYIGPLFESQGHGYETTDYRAVDRRLGTNGDLREYVKHCHSIGMKVVVDGVFNHVGRDFFAFCDLLENRESSSYRDWFCNVNFGGNNEYNDGLSYDNWGGYNLLVKLNLRNPAVKNYLFDSVRFWISEFDIDGIRLDAADVLDHDFMRELRSLTDSLKSDFWLMGEVIHGNYSMWANDTMLHSVTNYELHKALYSGHNDRNYFEIAHNVKRMLENCKNTRLYTFVDNHDVSRIASKLNDRANLYPVSVLLYALPGIPSVYYGSEFAVSGEKQRGDDWNLRPALRLEEYQNNEYAEFLTLLGRAKRELPELSLGEYRELYLSNRQYAFARVTNGGTAVATVNNDSENAQIEFELPFEAKGAFDVIKAYRQSSTEHEADEKAPDFSVYHQVEKTAAELSALVRGISSKEEADKARQLCETLKIQLETATAACFGGQSPDISFSADSSIRLNGRRLCVTLPANSGTIIKIV